MSTSLQIESFADINIIETSQLAAPAAADATEVVFTSTQGFTEGQTIYIGTPAREGCEKAVIDSVDDETTVTLTAGLGLAHSRYEAVTGVLGGSIHIYRAANVDDSVPADGSFSVLATRTIDPDQQSTYYTDSTGSSDYWYKLTYYDPLADVETSLADAVAVRGDDFRHYASITEIRRDAGFLNAPNLSDVTVDQHRRAAEAEINATLASAYTVPFDPVPEIIHTLTIQLAAGLLQNEAYRGQSQSAKDKIAAARKMLMSYKEKDGVIVDEDGVSTATSSVNSYPDADAHRAFEVDMIL